MPDVYVVDALRTPVGRHGGSLASTRPDDLAAAVLSALVTRVGVDPARIEDVILGCANQAGEDNRNVGRMAALLAGFPVSVPGLTVNRLCGSGLAAVVAGANAITSGEADLILVGGVESMSRAPMVMPKASQPWARGNVTAFDSTLGWRFVNPRMEEQYGTHALGETAELVAELYRVSREAQDEFALASQRKWAAADAAGRFLPELCPLDLPATASPRSGGGGGGAGPGAPGRFARDEHPRPEVTGAELAALRPAFRKPGSGTVTAGNSSGINDGAASLLLASEKGLRALSGTAGEGNRRTPLARFVGSAVVGVEPRHMGLGPIPATRKLLQRHRLSAADLDRVELNEAFAAQAIPCIRELGLDPARVNVNGGAIAIGHPLGASGARLATTLCHELRRMNGRLGLASMCIGVGQGIAVLFEGVA